MSSEWLSGECFDFPTCKTRAAKMQRHLNVQGASSLCISFTYKCCVRRYDMKFILALSQWIIMRWIHQAGKRARETRIKRYIETAAAATWYTHFTLTHAHISIRSPRQIVAGAFYICQCARLHRLHHALRVVQLTIKVWCMKNVPVHAAEIALRAGIGFLLYTNETTHNGVLLYRDRPRCTCGLLQAERR